MKGQVLYIVGGGHSGSTLLSLVISSSPGVFSLGEVYYYNSYNYPGDEAKLYAHEMRTCSCGVEHTSCGFWNDVRKVAGKKISIERRRSFKESLKTLWNIYAPLSMKARFRLRTDDNSLLFESVETVLDDRNHANSIIIDASKDPRRLVELVDEMGADRIKVIHLVRDGRGYVNSYANPRKKRTIQAGLPPENFLLVALRWIIVNVATGHYLRRYNLDHMHVSYDLFCQDPDSYVRAVNDHFSMGIPKDYLHQLNENEHHDIHGNMMRFATIDRIRRDESWRHQLPAWQVAVLNPLLFLFNRMYVSRDDVTGRQ